VGCSCVPSPRVDHAAPLTQPVQAGAGPRRGPGCLITTASRAQSPPQGSAPCSLSDSPLGDGFDPFAGEKFEDQRRAGPARLAAGPRTRSWSSWRSLVEERFTTVHCRAAVGSFPDRPPARRWPAPSAVSRESRMASVALRGSGRQPEDQVCRFNPVPPPRAGTESWPSVSVSLDAYLLAVRGRQVLAHVVGRPDGAAPGWPAVDRGPGELDRRRGPLPRVVQRCRRAAAGSVRPEEGEQHVIDEDHRPWPSTPVPGRYLGCACRRAGPGRQPPGRRRCMVTSSEPTGRGGALRTPRSASPGRRA